MHPTAVAGFLLTPRPELRIEGQSRTVLDSLCSGGAVEPVLRLIEVAGRPSERRCETRVIEPHEIWSRVHRTNAAHRDAAVGATHR
jgi:hypothetical protein